MALVPSLACVGSGLETDPRRKREQCMRDPLSQGREVAPSTSSGQLLPAPANPSTTLGSVTSAKPRGFALMAPEAHREIARLGGRAAHARGVAHKFSVDEAREAGRKGGLAVSQDREHMATIGREGGLQRRRRKT